MADLVVHCVCFVLVVLLNLVAVQCWTRGADEQHPVSDFSRHIVVKPRIYHGREKRQISTTKEEGTKKHIDHLIITLPVEGEDLTLDLVLNRQLIPKNYFKKYQENGSHKIVRPSEDEIELCHYNGKIRGYPESWVALSTCRGLSGVIFDGSEMYYVEKGPTENLEEEENSIDSDSSAMEATHYFYKHSDLAPHNKSCGYGGDAVDPDKVHSHTHNRMLRYKRSTEQNDNIIRGPYNANKESKYVELVLVVDNREFKELGEKTSNVEKHCTNIANIINALYAPLNIYIALVGVVIWTEHDEISFSTNGDTTLTNFLHYRREKLVKEHPNDNAQLLTKMNFENGVVGKALKGPMCTYEYSGGVNTDHSVVVGLVATTVAHEMGHNFGMEHDTNECQCPEDRCIMAPSSSSVAPTHWSSCSLNYLLLAFTHGMDYCLKNKPAALFDSPVCGNGFVEPGEQCDCGLQEHCDNPCCDASTCMLYSNASCATGECCDLNTCKPKNAGTLCRSADYECDLPEYCTGQSEYCPADIYKMDTEVCDHGKAFCYHGFCRTRTDQCKLLWGETGKSSDEQCYKMNVKGTRHGNCGYNKFNQSFFKCHDDNVLCGMLHCKHFNEKLEFGMESVSILSHSFINLKGSVVACRTAIVDLGINQVDPGLAPDGARCGEDKMCVNQKCMPVSSLRMAANICPHDCNGNGWCNNLGHCHCKEGFAPPFCENPGHGGSEDSGPASDPNAHKEFVAALFIIFLGIIPTLLIFAFVVYYLKRNGLKLRKPKMLMMMRSSPGAAGGGGRGVPPPISKTPPKSRTGAPFSSDLAKRPEDNHSLLQPENATTSPPGAGFKNEFFGNFNGFTLTPMKKSPSPEVVRSAPAPPVVPNGGAKQNVGRSNTNAGSTRMNSLLNKSVARAQSFKNNITGAIASVHSASAAPAAPPPPPPPLFTGIPTDQQKPVISSPILENSTCTAKELISPLRNASQKGTFRAAPEVPATAPPPLVTHTAVNIKENQRPLSTPDSGHSINLNSASGVVPEEMPRKPKDSATNNNGTLHRITSFLKPADKKPGASSKNQQQQQVKASKILDKNALRSMPISNPIPQSQNTTALPIKALPVNTEEGRAVVMRAQSMRGGKVTQRPNIPNFGSMRQPNGGGASRRPVSIPSGVRPKSPPPPRPPGAIITEANNNPGSKITIPSLPGYQKPASNANHKNKTSVSNNNHQYDDCLNKQTIRMDDSTDNIYAVIEESPMVSPEKTKNKGSSGSSTEDMGLLTEIVSEIQNRNFDSIYSTSTLARKKKQQQEEEEREQQIKSPSESEASYVNTSSLYKSPEGSYYSNMSNLKSSASSTSSGYIQPSMVNVPTVPAMKENKPEQAGKSGAGNNSNVNSNKPPSLRTFKSDDSNSASTTSSASNNSTRPFGSTFAKPPGRLQSLTNPSSKPSPGDSSKTVKSPPSPSGGGGKTTPKSLSRQTTPTSLNRQTTPPNLSRQTTPTSLQTRKPSPTRPSPPVVASGTSSRSKTTAVANNKSANSPDVVSSCNNKTLGTTKPPDLVNNNNSGASHTASINKKPSISSAKPIGAVSVPAKTQSKFGGTTSKSVSFKASSAQDPSSNAANKKSPGEIGKTAAITNNVATKPGGALGAAKGVERKTSNVASLQQKFESKTATSPNSKSVVKAKT